MKEKFPGALKPASASVDTALILICEKCGRKLAGEDGANLAVEFQKELKGEIMSRLGKGVVRAVATSCLDVCPQSQIAMAISRFAPGGLEFFTAQPEDLEALIPSLIDSLTSDR